jgi:hypothetical protein
MGTPTPDRHDSSVDLVDEMQLNLTGTSKVLNTVEPKSADPVFTDFSSRGSVTLESVQDGDGILVGDWQTDCQLLSLGGSSGLRRDRGLIGPLCPGCVFICRFARCTGISGVDRYLAHQQSIRDKGK